MPTPSQIKAGIDSEITNKTGAYSISHVDVGTRMKQIVDVAAPLQFATTVLRNAYLTNPDRQALIWADDLQDGNKYYLNLAKTAWIPLGDSAPKFETISFTNQATLTIAWDATRKAKFGDAAQFIIETLGEDGKYRVQYGLEIVPDSIINTTQYTIDLGGANQTGRVTIK